MVGRIVDPGGTGDVIASTKDLDRGSAKDRPSVHLRRVGIWKRIAHQICAAISVIGIPIIEEIAQRDPGILPLADLFKGHFHGLEPIQIREHGDHLLIASIVPESFVILYPFFSGGKKASSASLRS